MNLKSFANYTNVVKQLIGFCNHFGFDEADIDAIQAYCQDGYDKGLLVDEDISSLVDFSYGLKLVTGNVSCDLLLSVDASKLVNCSLIEIIDDLISYQKNNFFDFVGNTDHVSIKVLSVNDANVSISQTPFSNRLKVKIKGDMKILFSFYVADRKNRLSIESDEIGYVLKEDILALKGRFGLPLQV